MPSGFLFNAALWEELAVRIPKAGIVRVAVAYLGSGASSLLPLKSGDRLVVNMSLRSVRAGSTDPREVKKYLRKGVEVFSRSSLHAKFFVIDRTAIVGSANVSQHAKSHLDEAAILTTDPATVLRARATFERLCTEPVRKDYLEKCIREYRPPQYDGQLPASPKRRPRPVQSKLWLISGLRYSEVPENEKPSAERATKRMERKTLEFERSEVNYIHYPTLVKFFANLREGDWALHCFSDSRGSEVWPPARYLGREEYSRGKGKKRYLLFFEEPVDGEPVRWPALRRSAPEVGALRNAKPRTGPIVGDADSDAILRLWDTRGRPRARRK